MESYGIVKDAGLYSLPFSVAQLNDFFWPSLMLHTREHMTLQEGLVALQGMFVSDTRGVAAGSVMTIIPILIVFIALQRHFVRALTGAVKD